MIEFESAGVVVPGPRGEDVRILEPVTCTFPERRVSVIGPNGSGKSTLVRLINGLALPDSGAVRVNGLDTVTDGPAVRRQVGFVFTDPDSQLVMPTVVEDVVLSLRRSLVDRPSRRSESTTSSTTVGITSCESGSVKTKPTWRRTAGPSVTVSRPLTRTAPLSGSARPLINRTRVDFPEPFGPMTLTRRSGRVPVTGSRIRTSSPPGPGTTTSADSNSIMARPDGGPVGLLPLRQQRREGAVDGGRDDGGAEALEDVSEQERQHAELEGVRGGQAQSQLQPGRADRVDDDEGSHRAGAHDRRGGQGQAALADPFDQPTDHECRQDEREQIPAGSAEQHADAGLALGEDRRTGSTDRQVQQHRESAATCAEHRTGEQYGEGLESDRHPASQLPAGPHGAGRD